MNLDRWANDERQPPPRRRKRGGCVAEMAALTAVIGMIWSWFR